MKELDFLPRSYHLAIARRRQWRRNFVLSLLAIVSLAGLHQVNEGRIRSTKANLQAIDEGIGSFRQAHGDLTELSERKSRLSRQAALAGSLKDDAPLDAIIAEITAMLNDGMALRTIEITAQPPEEFAVHSASSTGGPMSVTGDKAEGRGTTRLPASRYGPLQARMTGIAGSDMEVGVFYGRMGASSMFDHLRMNYSRETEHHGRRLREFEITLAIQPVEGQP
jgi:hypothetical protein